MPELLRIMAESQLAHVLAPAILHEVKGRLNSLYLNYSTLSDLSDVLVQGRASALARTARQLSDIADGGRDDLEALDRITRSMTDLLLGQSRAPGEGTYINTPVSMVALGMRLVASEERKTIEVKLDRRLDEESSHSTFALCSRVTPDAVAHISASLIWNALEASPPSSLIRVTTAVEPDSTRSTPVARLTVTDFGAGIPASDRDRIFEPFFSTKPSQPGLGLSVVQSAVNAFNGSVDVISATGTGTTFGVRFPLQPVTMSADPTERRR